MERPDNTRRGDWRRSNKGMTVTLLLSVVAGMIGLKLNSPV